MTLLLRERKRKLWYVLAFFGKAVLLWPGLTESHSAWASPSSPLDTDLRRRCDAAAEADPDPEAGDPGSAGEDEEEEEDEDEDNGDNSDDSEGDDINDAEEERNEEVSRQSAGRSWCSSSSSSGSNSNA